ncbi:ATP-binding protein [Inediibacterium massiliense]|uniref:ATP-binding protein n=1 Tax=Inediibacterium massiliense TaxID=1658111 RepID=UPI0006B67949|nr:ATP-binding protein [Inediibacterium massiliense]
MKIYRPKVKDTSVFREIAQNIVNPLEILREAISNSHDAEAKNISIIVFRNDMGKFVLEIQDDGNGMDLEEIHRFFNLGDSNKNKIGIGEKGLGTKIYFKSDRITIFSQNKNKKACKVVMEKPWKYLCNDTIPEYTVEILDSKAGRGGTTVSIEGYMIDNPERYFNFETIKDYILWFTAAGSFKTYFAHYTELNKYVQNMQVAPRIFIEDKIARRKGEIGGVHRFSQPNENPKVDVNEVTYKKSVNYCRHFGPFHRATNINGEYISFQMYGTISGLNCRRRICKLKQGETLKSRFGIYLAKDFIPLMKKNNLMTDPNYHHYHILINSQIFELTADRNNISNQEDPKVKWVFSQARKIIREEIIPLAEQGYFKLRKNEEAEYNRTEKIKKINMRLDCFDNIDNLYIRELPILKPPYNEAQVALLFAVIMSNPKISDTMRYISKIGDYSHQSTTDMICLDHDNNKVLVEVEYKLSNLFKHDHPYETFDYVVCWEVDLDINEKKRLRDGNILCLMQENGQWILKYGTQKIIPVIELKKIINNLKNRMTG